MATTTAAAKNTHRPSFDNIIGVLREKSRGAQPRRFYNKVGRIRIQGVIALRGRGVDALSPYLLESYFEVSGLVVDRVAEGTVPDKAAGGAARRPKILPIRPGSKLAEEEAARAGLAAIALREDGYRFSRLAVEIARSRPFRYTR